MGCYEKKFKSYKNTNYLELCIAQHLYEFEYLYPLKKYSYVCKKFITDIVSVYPGPNLNIAPLELIEDYWDRIVDW